MRHVALCVVSFWVHHAAAMIPHLAESSADAAEFDAWRANPKEGLKKEFTREHSFFYIIDTHSEAQRLREALRNTWLKWAVNLKQAYRFFLFPDVSDPWGGNRSDSLMVEARYYNDMVFIQPEDMPWLANDHGVLSGVKARQGNLIRAAMQWALRETSAETIVKVDHDGVVCPQHLACQRASMPLDHLFWGAFWGQGGRWCRADENFQVFSRDVVARALDVFNSTRGWNISANWARGNWDRLARYWWLQGELHLVDDTEHIESQQCWHSSHHFQRYEENYIHDFQTFCGSYVFGHIWPSQDIKVMYKLFDLQDQQQARSCNHSIGWAAQASRHFKTQSYPKMPRCAESVLRLASKCATWDTC